VARSCEQHLVLTPVLTAGGTWFMLREPDGRRQMADSGSTPATLDRVDEALQGLGEPDRRLLGIHLERIRAALLAGATTGNSALETRFRVARREAALHGNITDLIAHVNMLVNDPAVGPGAREARELLRTLTVA
jgi:hypothetical protein